ncbi:MAG: hypothetical protein KUG82_18290 [Pseudomonadales bacterium]|nr:hypothetical protein [Pseudomonadales bacterium]
MPHPQAEQLLAYAETPEADEFHTIRDHLLTCQICRIAIERGVTLTSQLKAVGHDMISDEGKTTADLDLKASLHQLTHESAMQRELSNKQLSHTQSSSKLTKRNTLTEILNIGLGWLTQSRPIWATASVSCLLLIIPLMLSDQFFNQQGHSTIDAVQFISYQDSTDIILTDPEQPRVGLGFFHQAEDRVGTFTGLEINALDSQTLDITWPPVLEAQEYEITIFSMEYGARKAIQTVTSETNHVSLSRVDLHTNRRYEWELSGPTKTNHHFKTSGGFIIKD